MYIILDFKEHKYDIYKTYKDIDCSFLHLLVYLFTFAVNNCRDSSILPSKSPLIFGILSSRYIII